MYRTAVRRAAGRAPRPARRRWPLIAALAAGLTACAVPAWSQAAATVAPIRVTATAAPPRPLPAGYYGINYDYGGVSSFPNFDGFDSQLAALGPGTLRYPGGTGANYFHWRLGYPANAPTHNPGSCAPPNEQQTNGVRFTLRDLLAAYRATGATPIFDLNVMTSTLHDQVLMLQRAQSLQLPVVDVELGNELYLCNNDYVHYFPTAAAYGATVARYVKTLHADFPGVTVAAVGALRANTERTKDWNRDMLNTAQADGGLPDAITLHEYPSSNTALTTAGLPALFTEPYNGVQQIDATLSALPIARPAWITEYNLRPRHARNRNPAQATYAQALFAAEMDLLAREAGGVDRINYWTSLGPAVDNAYGGTGDTPSLTPSGLALTWVDQAAACATATSRLDFVGGPTLGPGGKGALVGRVYTSGTTQREVLLNLSGDPVVVHGASAIRAGEPYRQGTGDPIAPMSTATQVTVTTGTTGRNIMLPAYSITEAGPGGGARVCDRRIVTRDDAGPAP